MLWDAFIIICGPFLAFGATYGLGIMTLDFIAWVRGDNEPSAADEAKRIRTEAEAAAWRMHQITMRAADEMIRTVQQSDERRELEP